MEIGPDDLWTVEPASFVAERDALAKRLRAAGERAAAAEIKKRRRPPVTAWALNAVARDEPELINRVVDTGAVLEAALLAGPDDRASRADAQQAERQATDELITAAAARIGGTAQHVTDQFRARLVQTIRAAQLDDAVALRLRSGTLADDERPTVFGFAPEPGSPAPARPEPRPKPGARPKRPAAAPAERVGTAPAEKAAPPSPLDATDEPAPKPVRRIVDKASEKAAEKAAREAARAARIALAYQQDEAQRLAKRADRLEERARERAADAQAAAAEARSARADADRATAALTQARRGHEADD